MAKHPAPRRRDPIPLLRQRNPSGRLTYWEPTLRGYRRVTRADALHMVDHGDAFWIGEPQDRPGPAGAPSVAALVAMVQGGELSLDDLPD